MWKIVIVDDETIIRKGLRQYIEESPYLLRLQEKRKVQTKH